MFHVKHFEGSMKTNAYIWMVENNISKAHLAYRAGVSVQTVRRWLLSERVSQETHDKIIGSGLRGVGCPRWIRDTPDRSRGWW